MAKSKFNPTVIKTEILETKEYNVFVLDKKNRPIDEERVSHFMKMFADGKNYMNEFPAIVSEDFIILDGQHRFEACKRMNIPFTFRWTDRLNIDNVTVVQANAGWKPTDFLHSFIQQGKQDYIIVQRFINKYGLPSTTCAVLLGMSKSGTSRVSLKKQGFYTGDFHVRSEDFAHKIAGMILDFYSAGFRQAKQRTFILALVKAQAVEDYDHKKMMDKFENFGSSIMKPQVNTEQYIRNLEQLYNYRQPEGTKIRFI